MSSASSTHSDDASVTSAPADELTFNLQVLSPSVGVNRPIVLPNIAASTTLKELKEKIRQALPLRPSDEQQRLIHRGRALTSETDTLLRVIGEVAIRSGEQQTMHLVLREAPSTSNTTPSAPAPVQAPVPPPALRSSSAAPQAGPQPPPGLSQRPHVSQSSTIFSSLVPPTQPHGQPVPGQTAHPHPHHHHHHHHHHQQQQPPAVPTTPSQMTQWLQNTASRHLAQNQRVRAGMGMRGIGDNGGQEAGNGRASPVVGHYLRETVGPAGQTYQVETIIRGNPPPPPGQPGAGGSLSPSEVQQLLRSADLSQLASTMNNGVQRTPSNTSLHARFTNPGVTVPVFPPSDSRNASRRATPDIVRSVSGGSWDPPQAEGSQVGGGRGNVEVYILSSPEGPRALLVNNSTSETYYSPRLRTQASHSRLRNFTSPTSAVSDSPAQQLLPGENQQPQAQEQQGQGHGQAPPAPNADAVPAGEGLIHPHNPQAGLPPLLLRAGPYIWLLFRLGIFVWLFASPNSSWSRWLSIIGMAIFVFVYNVGVLNNAAAAVWRPLGQQLENLLPRLEHQQPQRDEPQPHLNAEHPQEQGRDAQRQARNPNPADIAARLVAQHQQNRQGWLQSVARRVERASLLFIASLAPGVAEGHIANMERQQREAEAAEAARQAEAEAQAQAQTTAAEGADGSNADGGPNATDNSSAEAATRREPGNEQQRDHGQNQPPLIVV